MKIALVLSGSSKQQKKIEFYWISVPSGYRRRVWITSSCKIKKFSISFENFFKFVWMINFKIYGFGFVWKTWHCCQHCNLFKRTFWFISCKMFIWIYRQTWKTTLIWTFQNKSGLIMFDEVAKSTKIVEKILENPGKSWKILENPGKSWKILEILENP